MDLWNLWRGISGLSNHWRENLELGGVLFDYWRVLNLNLMEQGEGGDFPPKKVQSDTAGTAAVTSDIPLMKLARQLDFTAFGGASAAVVLPEHPQSQPQAQAQHPVTMPVPPQTTHPSVRVV